MPNWCENDLIVSGNKSNLEELPKKLSFKDIISPDEDKEKCRDEFNKLSLEEKKRNCFFGEYNEEDAFNQFWFNKTGYD